MPGEVGQGVAVGAVGLPEPAAAGWSGAGFLHRAPAIQAGRAVQPVRGKPAAPRPASPVPPGLGTLVPMGHQEGDHGGLPGPPRHAHRRTQQTDTPRTRHLPPGETSVPAGGKHRIAADDLNRPSGLLGPRAVISGMRGPEGAPVQRCTGATRPWCRCASPVPGGSSVL